MRIFLYSIFIITFFCCLLLNCQLFRSELPDPGVVISWDVEGYDKLEEFYNIRDEIQTLNVPFTFYIRSPALLTDEQANMCKELQQYGHEIGYHTRFHTDAITYILIDEHSMEEYINFEIIPGLEDYENHGIIIKNFAYPLAHHYTDLDNYLLEHFFDSLRSVSPFVDWCYYKGNDNRVIAAYWIDSLEMVSEESLLKNVYGALRKAKRRNFILNLYGHNINVDGHINNGTDYETSLSRLQKIINYARELELKFFRMEDLFSNQ